MKHPKSTLLLICLCVATVLPTPAQTTTPPPAGKFGLPAAKPATSAMTPATSPAASALASAASSNPAPAAPAAQAAIVKNPLSGDNIKTMYATIVATTQGALGGANAKIQCTKYQFQPAKPVDANTGLARGGMKAGPITITKRWDAASAGLLQALATNEILKTVTLEFMEVGLDGREALRATVTLTNAGVASVNQYFDSAGAATLDHALEDVSFTFSKMTITYPVDHTGFSWTGTGGL